jgi:hypothetical protein
MLDHAEIVAKVVAGFVSGKMAELDVTVDTLKAEISMTMRRDPLVFDNDEEEE